jgi:hypothetical protein
LRSDDSITDWLLGLGGSDGRQPDDVILTVLDPLQQAARDAMSGKTGAVVVLDVATGAVLAYVSSPSYDPNRVAAGTLDPEDAVDAVIDRVADRVLPPGSTFKVIVSAAALDAGVAPSTTFPDAEEYLAPGSGAPIGNAGGGFCGDGGTLTLAEALVVSCNAIFARLAVDLGADPIVRAAEQAGFDAYIPWETGAARSALAASGLLASDPGALAQTGIGERDVRVSPLHMALIAAAIGNGDWRARTSSTDSSAWEICRRSEPQRWPDVSAGTLRPAGDDGGCGDPGYRTAAAVEADRLRQDRTEDRVALTVGSSALLEPFDQRSPSPRRGVWWPGAGSPRLRPRVGGSVSPVVNHQRSALSRTFLDAQQLTAHGSSLAPKAFSHLLPRRRIQNVPFRAVTPHSIRPRWNGRRVHGRRPPPGPQRRGQDPP